MSELDRGEQQDVQFGGRDLAAELLEGQDISERIVESESAKGYSAELDEAHRDLDIFSGRVVDAGRGREIMQQMRNLISHKDIEDALRDRIDRLQTRYDAEMWRLNQQAFPEAKTSDKARELQGRVSSVQRDIDILDGKAMDAGRFREITRHADARKRDPRLMLGDEIYRLQAERDAEMWRSNRPN